MELLRGEELIPQKGKLNLTVHKGPVRRSLLCCLRCAGGGKRSGEMQEGRNILMPALVASRARKQPLCFQKKKKKKKWCGCYGKSESL